MFRRFIGIYFIKMSSERKAKDMLSKKLNAKKVPKRIELNGAEAEKEKQAKKNTETKLEGGVIDSKLIKTELLELHKKPAVKRSTRKVKLPENEETLAAIDVLTTQPIKTRKSPNKNKVKTLNEEPCSSKKIKKEVLNDGWEPLNWKLILENIRQMRSDDNAPVDTMGCHKCADENADEKTQRFQKLVALMLSSQTKDEITYHAMLRLREVNLTPEVICSMKASVLENILHPVSFYKNKAKYLQQTSKILIEKYDSDIPSNIKELIALPGVGPKMAHICMSTAWREITGIGVDVHVHRISNRIGWLPTSTKEPEQTRIALEAWLPQSLWAEVNHLLVGFGQTVCLPIKPKCSTCLNRELCPFGMKTLKNVKIPQILEVADICDKLKFKKSKLKS
ncbi:hypothetical protein DOY81_010885 [Sarcophaga bullata]|nr:hypothetical protein DOY81_010885 [Sarcophaga bullata]